MLSEAAPRPAFDAVVLAASFGGLEALTAVLGALPAGFPVPVAVVQHRAPESDLLPALLRARTALPVHAADAQELADGAFARPGVHVLPPRPASAGERGGRAPVPHQADELMGALAQRHGARTCAVVLTGRLDDGARGVRAVKRAGGWVLVQSPASARAPGMPTAAIATGCADLVLPLRALGAALVALSLAPGATGLFARPVQPWADLADA
ncbi:chemotaxis protein CheB [Kineococcus indalonis]|uniref:chemotaxis protein CheB n=1 Tax=Kineococcus indalonis TaxID=2696566 RepID=UPI001412F4C4|nr:chemotaxis protein CheB [Kineococcus indalonis]NAZ88279.1 chemotaxis protein CheB [Kineococcus indalonis]